MQAAQAVGMVVVQLLVDVAKVAISINVRAKRSDKVYLGPVPIVAGAVCKVALDLDSNSFYRVDEVDDAEIVHCKMVRDLQGDYHAGVLRHAD